MNRFLVICEGNICRSPMAEALLAAALPQAQVRSAGLGALIGSPADPEAVRLMQARGIDITPHRATQVTREMCLQSDMVLVMEAEQRQRLEALYPQVRGRVMTLGHYIEADIPDPYRQGEAAFREALALIDQGIAEWLQRIRKL